MQSFAGAETTRRFSSILNNTWPKDMPPAEIGPQANAGAEKVGIGPYDVGGIPFRN
jgi:hypothetical protein